MTISKIGVVAMLVVGWFLTGPVAAQQGPAVMTLDEAIQLAHRHNPGFQAVRNDLGPADWSVREAWGAFLPSAGVNGGMQYQASGSARFGVFTAEDLGFANTPSYYLSNYSIGLSYGLSAAMFSRLSAARAARRATEAEIDAAAYDLNHNVTNQYIVVVRARDLLELRRQELERARRTFELAQARVDVGSAIALEAKQAEVERGRAEVAVLRAENAWKIARLDLLRLIGVDVERPVRLSTEFTVFNPPWTEDELVQRTLASQPQLAALEARADAAAASLNTAQSAYLPTLQVSAGWSGYTREVGDPAYLMEQARVRASGQRESCELTNELSERLVRPLPGTPADCSVFALTDADRTRILENNSVFPFSFTEQPFTVNIGLSFPIFQGFSRPRQVATARAQEKDTRATLRAERLRLRTTVVAMLQTLEMQYEAAILEARNKEVAAAQLELATARYRVGSASLLELTEAETLKAQADQAYLNAIYSFHTTLAQLEAAVGAPLRNEVDTPPANPAGSEAGTSGTGTERSDADPNSIGA